MSELEALQEYGRQTLRSMDYDNVELNVLFNEKLWPDACLRNPVINEFYNYQRSHSISVEINPKNVKGKKRRKYLGHELGHYHIYRSHPRFYKTITKLRAPDHYLRFVSPKLRLFTYAAVLGLNVLSLTPLFEKVPRTAKRALSALTVTLMVPFLIEESLAGYYGRKYSPKM